MKELNCAGLWWTPSSDQKLGGTLTFSSSEGICLSVFGSFEGRGESARAGSYPVILGVTSDGNLMTLCNCLQSRSHETSSGFKSEDYVAEVAYIGAHFSEPSQIRFHSADLQYSELSEWVGLSGFKTEHAFEEEGLRQHGVKYTAPKEVTITTKKGTLSIRFTFQSSGDRLREVKLGQTVWISIDAQEELSVDDWHAQFITPLQNFLTLATDKPNSIVDAFVYSKLKTLTMTDDEVIERPIHVIYRTAYRGAEHGQRLFPGDMLFTFNDIANRFPAIIDRWLEISTELDSICNLFFSVQHAPNMYMEQKFLSIVQAVESYHRRRIRNHELSEEEHRARLTSITSATPAKHREWLNRRLLYSNEPSLRERLKELIDLMDGVELPTNAVTTTKEAFIQKVLDTRNFLVHYDPSLKRRSAEGHTLYLITQVLSLLLECCFLRELGYTPEQCAQSITRTLRWKRVANEALQLK